MSAHWTRALLLAALTGACASPPPPPLLTISDKGCVAAPDLATALPIPLKSDSPVKAVFDAKTACLKPDGGAPRLYAAFVLPESPEPFFLSVTSKSNGRGVLAPHLTLLDSNGKMVREIAYDKFLFRGNGLNTAFRPQEGEKFIVITSEPAVVGQSSSGIVASIQTTTVPAGAGYFMMNTGREGIRTLVREHGGTVTISAELLAKAH